LHDWAAQFRPPYEGIRVLGTRGLRVPTSCAIFSAAIRCRTSGLISKLLHDPDVRRLIESLGPEAETLPLILFPDGERLAEPPFPAVASKLGLHTKAQTNSMTWQSLAAVQRD